MRTAEVRRRTTNLPDILAPLSTLQACLTVNTELLLVSRKNINLTNLSKSHLVHLCSYLREKL